MRRVGRVTLAPHAMSQRLSSFLSSQLGELPAPAQGVLASARGLQPGAGEALLQAGERWSSLFWVQQGVLRLFYLDRHGQAANKNFFLDGAMFWPLTPALSGEPVDFWIEAVGPARVWALPWPAWQAACKNLPTGQALERRTLAALLDDKMRREQQFPQCSARSDTKPCAPHCPIGWQASPFATWPRIFRHHRRGAVAHPPPPEPGLRHAGAQERPDATGLHANAA